jgi:hypothetical protein
VTVAALVFIGAMLLQCAWFVGEWKAMKRRHHREIEAMRARHFQERVELYCRHREVERHLRELEN